MRLLPLRDFLVPKSRGSTLWRMQEKRGAMLVKLKLATLIPSVDFVLLVCVAIVRTIYSIIVNSGVDPMRTQVPIGLPC